MHGLSVNKSFFSEWSSEMSYIFGFVVADGCIYVKRIKSDGTKYYNFNITSKDYSILEKIKEAMNAEQKIGKKRNGYFLQIGHQEICEDLLKLGMRVDKTHNFLGEINIPKKYFPDFVRGFFDGDGSVYIYEVNDTPQIKISFTSVDYNFLKWFNNKLCNVLDIPTKSLHEENNKGKMSKYNIYFYVEDSEKIAELMYRNDPDLFLKRKKQIFKEWDSIERRDYKKKDYPSRIGRKV